MPESVSDQEPQSGTFLKAEARLLTRNKFKILVFLIGCQVSPHAGHFYFTLIFMYSFQPMNAVLTSTVYCGGGRGGWRDLHSGGQTAAWRPYQSNGKSCVTDRTCRLRPHTGSNISSFLSASSQRCPAPSVWKQGQKRSWCSTFSTRFLWETPPSSPSSSPPIDPSQARRECWISSLTGGRGLCLVTVECGVLNSRISDWLKIYLDTSTKVCKLRC